MPAAVQISGLSKDFGPVHALADLNLEVEAGVVFGLLGPNGAGKTTLIRMLLDLIRPTAGHARVLGFDVNRQGLEVRRRCGYLPGDLKLPKRRTPHQFLAHLAQLRGDVDWNHATRLADQLGLDMERPHGEQSKGNRQKVGLVAALMSSPELLILDEPTSGLDPLRQQDVQELIKEQAAAGRTVLLSSHALDQVEHVADSVGIIREGSLVALESVSDLRQRAVREVEVRFADSVPDFSRIPGVEFVASESGLVRLRVKGHMDALVKFLAGHEVVDLTSTAPELDEVFLSYYGNRHGR